MRLVHSLARAVYPLLKSGGAGLAGLGDFTSDLATAIETVEGYYPPGTPGFPQGSVAWRDNNPGNLRTAPASFQQITPPAAAGYADFVSFSVGWAALLNDVTAKINRGLTLTQFLNVYAPAGDGNNPASYTATVAAALGIDPNVPLINYRDGTASAGDGSSSSSSSAGDGTTAAGSDDGAAAGSLTLDLTGLSVLPAGWTLPAAFDTGSLGVWWSSLQPLEAAAVVGLGVLLVFAAVE